MKILITGGRGFIGRKLQHALEKDKKNKVYLLVLNKDKDKNDENLKYVLIGDITDPNLNVSNFDIVYHLAAIANPRICEQNRNISWKTNVDGTRNIIENMKRGAKIIFMSSAHVYENGKILHKETEIPAPQSFYGLTKLVGEDIINYYSKTNGIKKTIFRLFNSYSIDQPEGFIVPDVIKKYKIQTKVEIINPNSEIDLVHIDDVVEVLVSASKKKFDGTFNICSSKPMKIIEIYKKIREYTCAKRVKEKIIGNNVKKLLGDNSKIVKAGAKFREFRLP